MTAKEMIKLFKKAERESRSPIGTDMYLPNHSGIASHPEAIDAFGGGGVAGSDTQVQFNDGGSMAGDAGLTYNKTTDDLTVVGDVICDRLSVADQILHTGDTDTKLEFTSNQMEFTVGGIEMLNFETTGQDTIVFNEQGQDIDFRVETDDFSNTLSINGNSNRVGIKTTNPNDTFNLTGGRVETPQIIAGTTTLVSDTYVNVEADATAAAMTLTLPPSTAGTI